MTSKFAPQLSSEFRRQLCSDNNLMTIQITNLRLRAYVGINEWEQQNLQDVVLNLQLDCRPAVFAACASDDIHDTVNYKEISKQVINYVDRSRFYLLEKLVAGVLEIALRPDLIVSARVSGEKPAALRFSDSVSVSISGSK